MAKKGKQPQRAPMAHKAPPPEADNPRVRCWNCREFGHKASSHRCPLKQRNRALAPQAMGSNKMKENLKPRNLRVQQNPGSINRPPRETEQRAWHEEQRQASCRRLPWRPTSKSQQNGKEETESCAYVRDPHTKRPEHNTKRKYDGDPDLTTCSPKKKCVMTSTASPIKGVERSTCLPAGSKNGQEGPAMDSPHTEGTHVVQDPTHGVHEKDDRPQPAFSTQGLNQTLIHQPQAKFPDGNSPSNQHAAAHSVGQDSHLILKVLGKRSAQTSIQTCQKPTKKPRLSPCLKSTQNPDTQPLLQGTLLKTLQPCHMPHFSPIPGVPGQPLDKGPWSSMPMTPPSHRPAEKLTTPAQIPPTTEKSEEACPCVPLSVLLEALKLSSSSEKGDGQ
ncbi:unnamed protein product [Pipistrellus nathusii]|uniref:Zinc knuckle domain-containing protein n=1 Tax=Pipistrellus nathusii TaxID=59473 RepID=A0ABN9ZWB3_PIPNA